MGEDPRELRSQLEDTRLRVGEEVDALSYKTDVGSRVGDYVDEKKEAVTSRLSGAKDLAMKPVPSRTQMRRAKATAEPTAPTAEVTASFAPATFELTASFFSST